MEFTLVQTGDGKGHLWALLWGGHAPHWHHFHSFRCFVATRSVGPNIEGEGSHLEIVKNGTSRIAVIT